MLYNWNLNNNNLKKKLTPQTRYGQVKMGYISRDN